jgi:hypothetical protein
MTVRQIPELRALFILRIVIIISMGVPLNFAIGASVNDPTTAGIVSDLHFTGNWLYGAIVSLDSCTWHIFDDQGNCTGNNGMEINAAADANCVESNNGQPYINTNNSLIGTSSARLNAQGTGTGNCYNASHPFPNGAAFPVNIYNYTGSQNYLNNPSNQYNFNAQTFNPTVTGNFCVGNAFTQTDASSCATNEFHHRADRRLHLRHAVQWRCPVCLNRVHGAVRCRQMAGLDIVDHACAERRPLELSAAGIAGDGARQHRPYVGRG